MFGEHLYSCGFGRSDGGLEVHTAWAWRIGDQERSKRVVRQIITDMVFINKATWNAPRVHSVERRTPGMGVKLSDLGIGEFVNTKHPRGMIEAPAPA